MPPVRVAREGVIDDELLRLFCRNSRFPEMVKGDTRASMAAIRLGERRLVELFARFGRAQRGCLRAAHRARPSASCAASCARWCREGSYALHRHASTATATATARSSLRYRLDVTRDRIVLDTSDSDDQVPGPVNFLMSPPVPAMVFGSYLLGEGSESIAQRRRRDGRSTR